LLDLGFDDYTARGLLDVGGELENVGLKKNDFEELVYQGLR